VTELGLGRQVEMLGHLTRPELERALAPAWVLAVPSVYDEPFANTAVESMMRGTAVVASAVGGSVELVEDRRTGRLFAAGDVAVLAGLLGDYARDASLRRSHGAAGRAAAVARFSLDRMVAAYQSLYESLCAGERRRAA
jgi:glycosyltransferase involved in cell wall biosynthesis